MCDYGDTDHERNRCLDGERVSEIVERQTIAHFARVVLYVGIGR